MDYGFSDHLMVQFTVSNKKVIHQQKYRLVRKFDKVNWDKLNLDLADDIRIQLAETSGDVNTICESITAALQELLDNQEPQRRIQISTKVPNFASTETKRTIVLRDAAMKTMKTTKDDDDIRQFRMLRNKVHKMLKQDKQRMIKTKFEDIEGKSKEQWKYTKEQAGWVKKLSPDMISIEGKTIREPIQIANAINYAQVTRNIKLHREVPKTETDFRENYKKLTKDKNLNFQLRTISMQELRQNLKEMKPTPSSGVDGLSLKTIKRVTKPLMNTLLNMVNTNMRLWKATTKLLSQLSTYPRIIEDVYNVFKKNGVLLRVWFGLKIALP